MLGVSSALSLAIGLEMIIYLAIAGVSMVLFWVDDPKGEGRQVGWVRLPAPEYCRPVRRIAVRCRQANGQWAVAVLISTLGPAEILALTQPTPLSCSGYMRLGI